MIEMEMPRFNVQILRGGSRGREGSLDSEYLPQGQRINMKKNVKYVFSKTDYTRTQDREYPDSTALIFFYFFACG